MGAFIVDEAGHNGLFGVFEDDGDTGYLYIYDDSGQGILKHLQIYNCSPELKLQECDVQVIWSNDGSKCGVKILGGMRGIIDIVKDMEISAKLISEASLPITDENWLKDFKLY